MDETVIKIEHLSKRYNINTNLQRTFVEEVSKRVKRIFQNKINEKSSDSYELWALKDINLSVKKGETIGIIGPNGAGKTTLLKLISNITNPTEGKIIKKGKIASLIQIGTGFHGELTGKENVFLYGSIMGMTKKEIEDKYDDIMAFAELKRFADTPVKRYSSGMYVRLGFAVAVYTEPDILLVDEVLAVGDISFRNKCYKKIAEMKKKGMTIILVSHLLSQVRVLCNRVIFLNQGEIIYDGEPSIAISEYYKSLNKIAQEDIIQKRKSTIVEYNQGDTKIMDVRFYNAKEKATETFKTGEFFKVVISYYANKKIFNPIFGILFRGSDGVVYTGMNTKLSGYTIEFIEGFGKISFTLPFLGLYPGIYFVEVAIHDSEFNYYDHIINKYIIKVEGTVLGTGLFTLAHNWEIIN